jgi:hypothetical protein
MQKYQDFQTYERAAMPDAQPHKIMSILTPKYLPLSAKMDIFVCVRRQNLPIIANENTHEYGVYISQ